jgi:hypothetical protein
VSSGGEDHMSRLGLAQVQHHIVPTWFFTVIVCFCK